MRELNTDRIHQLTNYLNKCSIKYYNGISTITDIEYDNLYKELKDLEIKENYRLNNSPTQKVGAKVLDKFYKVKLPVKMLSLDKIKNDLEAIKNWIGSNICVMSIKVDGGAACLEYNGGKLIKAYTRGDGEVGTDITDVVSILNSIPNVIPSKKHLFVIGEICIKKQDFDRINNNLPDSQKFSNPRNLATATLLSLDTQVAKDRNLTFYAFDIQSLEEDKYSNQMEVYTELNNFGFMTALNTPVMDNNIQLAIESYKTLAEQKGIPIDGMVVRLYNRHSYKEAGYTAKFPKGAIAYKFQDEVEETIIENIKYSMSKNGVLTPVIVVNPVELYDTTVSRLTGHNISYLKLHNIGIGDRVLITKSNEIIPQLVKNVTGSNNINIPNKCPYCLQDTTIIKENETEMLKCTNSSCIERKIKLIENYCDRANMNIHGMFYKTIKGLVNIGVVSDIKDIYKLRQEDILRLEKTSVKKANNIISAIEESRKNVDLFRFLTALNIEGVGKTTAKAIAIHYNNSLEDILNCTKEDLFNIANISIITATTIVDYIKENRDIIKELSSYLTFTNPELALKKTNILNNKTFCISGKLITFSKRSELVKYIQENGGKVCGDVTVKTDYLINNNILSISKKTRQAKNLAIPIINEIELIELVESNK